MLAYHGRQLGYPRSGTLRVHQACGNAVFALFEWLDADQLLTLHQRSPWLSGVALPKTNLIGVAAESDLVTRAHDLRLQVHVWTLRDDAVMREFSDVQAEYRALFEIGVDALFCDFPAGGVTERQRWQQGFVNLHSDWNP